MTLPDPRTGMPDPPDRCDKGHHPVRWQPGWRPCACPGARGAGLTGHHILRCQECLNERAAACERMFATDAGGVLPDVTARVWPPCEKGRAPRVLEQNPRTVMRRCPN